MIDKNKIVKYTGVTILSISIMYGGFNIILDEVMLSHEIHPCILSKVLGMNHRINKIKNDKDVKNVEFIESGSKSVGDYIVNGPAIIIDKEGNRDFYGIDREYTETKIVELNSELDSKNVYYIRNGR